MIWGNSSPGGNCAQLAQNLSDLFQWNWFPIGPSAHQWWAVQAEGVLPRMHVQGSLHTQSSPSLPVPAHTLLRIVYIWNQLCCTLSSTRDWNISFLFKGSNKLTRPVGHQLCLKEPLTANHLHKDVPKLLLTTRPLHFLGSPLFPQTKSIQTWPCCGMTPGPAPPSPPTWTSPRPTS